MAQEFGARLLGEVQECGLDEVSDSEMGGRLQVAISGHKYVK